MGAVSSVTDDESSATVAQCLSGIQVLSLEQAVAAPFCTARLAEHGARVIKVERPDVGDFGRGYDGYLAEGTLSSYFAWLNRGKESLEADLKDPEDLALVHSILAKSDVFVQVLSFFLSFLSFFLSAVAVPVAVFIYCYR